MDGGYGASVGYGYAVLCYAMPSYLAGVLCLGVWVWGEWGSWGVVVRNGWLIQHDGCVDGWMDGWMVGL